MRVHAADGPPHGEQEYLPDTNVLRTTLGPVDIVDFMPWDGTVFTPPGRIVRIVTARRAATVHVDVVPGHEFGPARKVTAFSTGIAFDGAVVNTGIPFDGRRATAALEPGDRLVVSIDQASRQHDPLSPTAALDLADRTATAWRRHLDFVTYDGPYAHHVRRSLLVLKGLTHHDTGAVVAAPTTSLPEKIGGERNWDYRYAWVRDSCLAIDAAYDAGLVEEAERFAAWLQRVLQHDLPLGPLYDVEGDELDGEERILNLPGYRKSQPVRVGNAAAHQLQLDMYADLVGVFHAAQMRPTSGSALQALWPRLRGIADWLADAWRLPDRGMWEIRAEPRHLVWSKTSCWYALARMTDLALVRDPLDLATIGWKQAANEILRWLEDHPVADEELDASLLRIAWRGPWPAEHPVVHTVVHRVLTRLSDGPFVYRYHSSYDDGLPPGEGAFLAASFWAVKALARLGRWDEAHERMEALCGFGGALGILPEEADPTTRAFLGNMPQAFTHLALVEAALALRSGPR